MKMRPTEQPGITLSYRLFVFSQLRAKVSAGFTNLSGMAVTAFDLISRSMSARPSECSLVVVKCRLFLSLTVSSSY